MIIEDKRFQASLVVFPIMISRFNGNSEEAARVTIVHVDALLSALNAPKEPNLKNKERTT